MRNKAEISKRFVLAKLWRRGGAADLQTINLWAFTEPANMNILEHPISPLYLLFCEFCDYKDTFV